MWHGKWRKPLAVDQSCERQRLECTITGRAHAAHTQHTHISHTAHAQHTASKQSSNNQRQSATSSKRSAGPVQHCAGASWGTRIQPHPLPRWHCPGRWLLPPLPAIVTGVGGQPVLQHRLGQRPDATKRVRSAASCRSQQSAVSSGPADRLRSTAAAADRQQEAVAGQQPGSQ